MTPGFQGTLSEALQVAGRPQTQDLLHLGRDQSSFAEKKLALKDKKQTAVKPHTLLRKLNHLLNFNEKSFFYAVHFKSP